MSDTIRHPNSQLLQGRVAVVTGASRGIGRAAALQLARLGAAVALVARSAGELAQAAQEIESNGGRALAIAADLGRHDDVLSAMDRAAASLGPVDILVNNAALMPLGLLAAGDPAEWRYALEVNLLGPYDLMRAALPGMLARGRGRVVNVSSKVAVMRDLTHRSAYVTSKAALDRLTLAAAAELAGTGVTVNAVYPGVTDTDMQAQLRAAPPGVISGAEQAMWRERHARGDMLSPAHGARLIAAAVLSDLQGQIVDITDELARRRLAGLPTTSDP
jgi:NAD(P)-dependent dehydrogenase (short-subunit alcohol dehydrogenase family)